MCFFFSSRRRHTRYWRDWSSDVCSSDLLIGTRKPHVLHFRVPINQEIAARGVFVLADTRFYNGRVAERGKPPRHVRAHRSEERRVGKEWRSGERASRERKTVKTTSTTRK